MLEPRLIYVDQGWIGSQQVRKRQGDKYHGFGLHETLLQSGI